MTRLWALALILLPGMRATAQAGLPDAPSYGSGYVRDFSAMDVVAPELAGTAGESSSNIDPEPNASPCVVITPAGPAPAPPAANWLLPVEAVQQDRPCAPSQNQIRPFVDANKAVKPLTPRQKARLAGRDIIDPFNLLTIAGSSAYFVASTPYSAYGPGLRGFGKSAGTSLAQDVTGETIGTFAVCTLFHEDPRYFRMPHRSIVRRVVHAVSHVAVAQGDDGRLMPNYENFVTSIAGAEIANLYVPGLETDAKATSERVASGFLSEPIGLLIAEFLPDVASHIHVRIVIVQHFINQIAAQQNPATGMTPVGVQ